MPQKVTAVIPARLHSRRFPDKVLYSFKGRPLLFYVWNEARKAKSVDRLAIATDSGRIRRAAEAFGAEVVRTSAFHRTGSDRVAEAAGKLGGDIVINIQADHLGLRAAVLDRAVAKIKSDNSIEFATVVYPIATDDELFDPNVVKAVLDADGHALWFSRLPLPYLRDTRSGTRARQHRFWGHIGVYFFRRKSLSDYHRWGRSPLEKAESLEQLRILEHGRTILALKTRTRPVAIDSPKDLEKLTRI